MAKKKKYQWFAYKDVQASKWMHGRVKKINLKKLRFPIWIQKQNLLFTNRTSTIEHGYNYGSINVDLTPIIFIYVLFLFNNNYPPNNYTICEYWTENNTEENIRGVTWVTEAEKR